MRPKDPYDRPISVTLVSNEVVFLGQGSASFSMTPEAARGTLYNLATALVAHAVTVETPGSVVLFVEDEPILREVGALLLEDAGYLVICTDSASEAIVALEARTDVHLLFTDINIPGEFNGLQLAAIVRSRWPAIHLLVTSGNPLASLDDLPSGGRFMSKPYAADEMLRQVRELIAA